MGIGTDTLKQTNGSSSYVMTLKNCYQNKCPHALKSPGHRQQKLTFMACIRTGVCKYWTMMNNPVTFQRSCMDFGHVTMATEVFLIEIHSFYCSTFNYFNPPGFVRNSGHFACEILTKGSIDLIKIRPSYSAPLSYTLAQDPTPSCAGSRSGDLCLRPINVSLAFVSVWSAESFAYTDNLYHKHDWIGQ